MTLPKYMPALDGLRGVAILMVILTHVATGWEKARSIVENTQGWAPTFRLSSALVTITDGAAHGVQLFFVISAFTLTVRAARDRESNWRTYAVRRIARVGPAYWLAGIAYTVVAGFGPRLLAPNGVSAFDLVIATVFASAWQGGASLAVVPGDWSIGCEVSFYIALPFLLWAINWRIWRAVLFFGLTILGTWIKHLLVTGPSNLEFWAFANPIEQAPVFLCGITAAIIALRLTLPSVVWPTLVLLVISIVVVPFSPVSHLSQVQFGIVAAIVVALARSPRRGFWHRRQCGKSAKSVTVSTWCILRSWHRA